MFIELEEKMMWKSEVMNQMIVCRIINGKLSLDLMRITSSLPFGRDRIRKGNLRLSIVLSLLFQCNYSKGSIKCNCCGPLRTQWAIKELKTIHHSMLIGSVGIIITIMRAWMKGLALSFKVTFY
jgi:hypothetical protein